MPHAPVGAQCASNRHIHVYILVRIAAARRISVPHANLAQRHDGGRDGAGPCPVCRQKGASATGGLHQHSSTIAVPGPAPLHLRNIAGITADPLIIARTRGYGINVESLGLPGLAIGPRASLFIAVLAAASDALPPFPSR